MPKVPVDYQKSVIYKIVCRDVNIKSVYVGSTTNLQKRLGSHRSCCKNMNTRKYNLAVYRYIRDQGGFNNWMVVLVEAYPCNNRFEKESRERYWIETLNARLNMVLPTRTRKEYNQKNAGPIAVYQKKYQKEYHQNNAGFDCDCGNQLNKLGISRHNRTTHHQTYINHLNHNYPKNKPLYHCIVCDKRYRTYNITTTFTCHACK